MATSRAGFAANLFSLACIAACGGTLNVPPTEGIDAAPAEGIDAAPTEGVERADCYPNGTCNAGLTCASNLCVRLDAAGSAGSTDIDSGAGGLGTGSGGSAAGAGGAGSGESGSVGDGGSGGSVSLPSCTSTTAISPAMTAATFCQILLAICPPANGYTTQSACEAKYSVSTKQICQSYHVCNARSTNDLATHCPHAQQVEVCVD